MAKKTAKGGRLQKQVKGIKDRLRDAAKALKPKRAQKAAKKSAKKAGPRKAAGATKAKARTAESKSQSKRLETQGQSRQSAVAGTSRVAQSRVRSGIEQPTAPGTPMNVQGNGFIPMNTLS